MALSNFTMGEAYTPAYQISATPYVTSSNVTLGNTKEIKFNFVTRFLTVKNTSTSTSTIAVAFTQNGLKPANSNFFILSGSETYTAELRTDRIFISGSVGATNNFTVIAGLTGIPVKNFGILTGSNGFGGVG